MKSMNRALDTLERNLKRSVYTVSDDDQKYALSLSIVNFIKCSSHAKLMKETF